VQRSPGDANGSRECAPDDGLRIVQSRCSAEPGPIAAHANGPRISSAPRRKALRVEDARKRAYGASQTRVNALMALRSVRGTSGLSAAQAGASLHPMDAEASPSRSIASHLRGALGAWRHAARLALDIALPTLCVACREPVDGEGVCAECWSKLSFIARPYCPRLGIPFVYDPGPELLSMEAIANPPAYARARAAVRYDDVARTLVHALKYQDRTDLAPAMGRWMARAGRELLAEADALIPVPLHWRRGWSRRYLALIIL
jgi:hypothetical protein